MWRVSVVGNSGSGKSTMAARIVGRLGVPLLELDGLVHQPGWTRRPAEEFLDDVDRFTVSGGWVVDGNCANPALLDVVWGRADTVVWVDTPRAVALAGVARRTARRLLTREELWNGNRETLRDTFGRDSVLLWAWRTHAWKRVRFAAAMCDPRWDHLRFIRIRTRAEADHLLARLPGRKPA